MPFPLYSIIEAINNENATQFVTVKNSKDSIGLFQCFEDLDLVDKSIENQSLRFQTDGQFLALPEKFTSFFRVFYEGKLIRSSYQFMRTGKEANNYQKNQTRFEYLKYQRDKLRFIVNAEFDILPPGMYFVIWKVTDISLQLYLDAYLVFRIRHVNEKEMIQKYRNSEIGIFSGKDKIDDEDLGISDFTTELASEWVSYRTQFIKTKELKNVRNL